MRIRTFLTAFALSMLTMLSCSASPAINTVRASILRIETIFPFDEKGVCTGFVVNPNRVLTAAHCLGPIMTADGQEAILLHADDYYDLALLATKSSKAPLHLRDYPVIMGESLQGTGYAWGWSIAITIDQAVLVPNVSPARSIASGIITHGGYEGGMSGGPITDVYGDVVGVIQRKLSQEGYGVGVAAIKAFLVDAGLEIR